MSASAPKPRLSLPARPRRVLLRYLSLLLTLCCALTGGAARAAHEHHGKAAKAEDDSQDTPLVAVMPFDGKETPTPPQQPIEPRYTGEVVLDQLHDRPNAPYKVVTPGHWERVARDHFHDRTFEIQAIAKYLGADLVVGGWLEKNPDPQAGKSHRLTVALYSNWAEPLVQLHYDVDLPKDSTKLDPQALAGRMGDLFQMVDHALGLTPPAPAGTSGQNAQGNQDNQSPLDNLSSAGQAGTPAGPTPNTTPNTTPSTTPSTTTDQAPPSTTPNSTPTTDQAPPPQPAAQSPVAQAEDSESAPLPRPANATPFVPPNPEARDLYYRRAPWRPIFDLRIGYLYDERHLTDNGSGKSFGPSGTSGLLLHGEVYPMAAFSNIPLYAAGLGVSLTAMLPFWPDIPQVSAPGQPANGILSAKEYRIDVGFLHWHWNFREAVLRPEVEAEALYGYHVFDLAGKSNIIILDIPSAAYSYLGGGVGSRLHLNRRLSAHLGLSFAGLLSTGPLGYPAYPDSAAQRGYHVYGPGSGWIWRLDASLALRLWRGLTVAAGVYAEQNLLSFKGAGDISLLGQPSVKVTSATDQYSGFFLSAGYVY